MMKSKVKRKEDNFAPANNNSNKNENNGNEGKGDKKLPPKDDLMIRLAMGQKVTVDKKEMKKLTNKNY